MVEGGGGWCIGLRCLREKTSKDSLKLCTLSIDSEVFVSTFEYRIGGHGGCKVCVQHHDE